MNVYLFRRYALFVVSLFINAFGISFITKALLGTSPVTSIMYVLSMFTSLTIGQWTILINLLFVACELLLMTWQELKSDLRMYLLQIPISLCFGTFIDCSMSILHWLEPHSYPMQILSLLVGCFILAVGIALEVKVSVAMVSGEYFVKVIAHRFRGEFGFVKLGFDVTLVMLACVLSFIFMGEIRGVREGTVVAALLVGPIVHYISPCYRVLDRWIKADAQAPAAPVATPAHRVITIAREYGSGGHLLGEMLARELGLQLYDRRHARAAWTRTMSSETSNPSPPSG